MDFDRRRKAATDRHDRKERKNNFEHFIFRLVAGVRKTFAFY